MADVDLQEMSTAKATFGGYSIIPVLKPLSAFWEEYVQTENRPLSRYILVSTQSSRKRLIETLRTWIENPELAGTYSFLSNNCVGALARLLEASGFPKTSTLDPKIPVNFDDWLKKSLISPFPGVRAESPRAVIEATAKALSLEIDRVYDGTEWPSDAAKILNNQLSDLQIKRLLIQLPHMPLSVRSELIPSHRFGNGGATLEDVMSFKTIPAQLYSLCDTSACMQGALRLVPRYWSSDEWQDAYRKDDFAFWLATGRRDPNDPTAVLAPAPLPRYPETLKYYQLLLNQ